MEQPILSEKAEKKRFTKYLNDLVEKNELFSLICIFMHSMGLGCNFCDDVPIMKQLSYFKKFILVHDKDEKTFCLYLDSISKTGFIDLPEDYLYTFKTHILCKDIKFLRNTSVFYKEKVIIGRLKLYPETQSRNYAIEFIEAFVRCLNKTIKKFEEEIKIKKEIDELKNKLEVLTKTN